MIRKILPILFLFTVTFSYAQEATYERIKKLFYEEFEYEKVIQLSEDLLNNRDVDDTTRIDLYLMRAVSFFAFDNNAQTRVSFENILRLDRTFSLDTRKVSSKAIIALFNEVKAEFLRLNPLQAASSEDISKILSVAAEKESLFKKSAVRNIVVPGWGQLTRGSTVKGITLSALSTINLAAMVYYAIDANTKENDYLKETNKFLIESKYSTYNSSYKTRNLLIGTYLALWLYSQIDLHLFNDALPNTEIPGSPVSLVPKENFVSIDFRLPL